MKAKFFLILFFLIINTFIISCYKDENCGPALPHFEITGIQSFNLRFTNSGLNPWEGIDNNQSIDWELFFVRFGFQTKYIAESKLEPNGNLIALSCIPPGHAGDKIGVDTLIIRTIYEYNTSYSAGDIINPIILMNDWTFYVNDFGDFVSVQDYISNNSEGVRDQQFEIKLNEAPSTSSQFAIHLTFKLNNGEEFTHTTETVKLK